MTGAPSMACEQRPASTTKSGLDFRPKPPPSRVTLTFTFSTGRPSRFARRPRVACGAFGKLVSNGETGLKWFETNKDWCQVPDQFVENFKADHDKIKDMRGKACALVSKMEKMQNQARQQQQQQQQGGNPFGGGLTGTYKIPQGAL